METYIIVKTAIYDHGVMWIGSDIEEGKKKSDFFASNHDDGHHTYQLRIFADPQPSKRDWQPDWEDWCDVVYVGVDSRLFNEKSIEKIAAPWPDFKGNVLRDGDIIAHPDGTIGVITFDDWRGDREDQWRVIYRDGSCGRLCLQVGHKGMAIKYVEPENSDLTMLAGRNV